MPMVFSVINPKKPQFKFESITVEPLPGSTSTMASMEVFPSVNIAMVFTAMNPNNVGIRYSPSKFNVMYKGMPIGVAAIPTFYKPSSSSTAVQTQLTHQQEQYFASCCT
ncbi:uncharacterized protein LOC131874217 [Cryptomeria japonica]|uniref:uncharacterized protein LOC131874217 n=1 Tax=Cryptomeria japonica TaxID=3369 RepID=UPI0027DAB306|nr:uncharacterized protein LOC131874217 [Cryptomeria japonica]